jgi:hypothetical protein
MIGYAKINENGPLLSKAISEYLSEEEPIKTVEK